MQKDLPVRKKMRLEGYDYSRTGAYFVTFCVKDKRELLARILVGSGFHARPYDPNDNRPCNPNDNRIQSDIVLSELGKEVQKTIEYISSNDNNVQIDKYVIMPNHVHIIICLSEIVDDGLDNAVGHGLDNAVGHGLDNAVGHGNPTLQAVVGRIKSYTTKRWNEICNVKHQTFWQTRFYDHIIRNEDDYNRIWQYIDENPAKWLEDKYYLI